MMSLLALLNACAPPMRAFRSHRLFSPLLFAGALCAGTSSLSAQVAVKQPAAPAAQKARPHKKSPAVIAAPPQVEAPQPPPPEKPKWPANDAPAQPSVSWDHTGLHIEARNSSLRQILNQVSTTTGAKVEGLGSDERVFGDYGPGPANDVLSQLLHGSSYNVLMIGDQGQGTPREVILSARTKGSPQQHSAMYPQAPVQDDEPDQPEPDEAPQPIIRPPMGQPANQPGMPMSPQERLMQMQQQQMQMQQQPNQPVVPLPQQPPDQ